MMPRPPYNGVRDAGEQTHTPRNAPRSTCAGTAVASHFHHRFTRLRTVILIPFSAVVDGKPKYTDFEVKVRTNLPVFRLKESSVRRRYSDFDWLRGELERGAKILVPKLPDKALSRQMPWVSEKVRLAVGVDYFGVSESLRPPHHPRALCASLFAGAHSPSVWKNCPC